MELRIQYTKTDDGVSIAYATVGEGSPLILCPSYIPQQLSYVLQAPSAQQFFDHLAKDRLLVMYDSRGFGMSDRDVTDFSLEARVLDLEAVVRAARLRRLALWASLASAPVAISYVVRHRREVTHLILYGAAARGADVMAQEPFDALIQLCLSNWELAAQVLGDLTLRKQYPEEGELAARVIRDSISAETMVEWLQQGYSTDVGALLPQVSARTLVLHRRDDALVPFALGQKLAAALPNAQFVPLEGTASLFVLGDTKPVLDAVTTFLGEGGRPRRKSASKGTGMVTVLFTDMESSTALNQRLGDAKAHEVRRTHNVIVRDALKAHGGSEIKHTGDGIMASFTTASSSLDCAIAIQQGVASHKDEHPGSPLGVYIGINAGEPIAEEDPGGRVDLFGAAINLAARICDHAEPAQILASDVVRQLVAGKQFLFSDLGETELRGFEDPVKLWEVSWREGQ